MESNLYRYMADPSLLNHDSLIELEQLVASYPYFSTARMLYLKNLAVLNDVRFNLELQRTAIYVPDRKMLFMLIEDVRLIIETDIQRHPNEKEDTFKLIDEFIDDHGGIPEDVVLLPTVSDNYFGWEEEEKRKIEEMEKTRVEEAEPEEAEKADSSTDIITGIITELEKEPIGRKFRDPNNDTSQYEAPARMGDYEQSDDSYFTETLAKIYIKQRRYQKALEIIRNISLKYPQKNIYFADQIRFLEKLIINTKNKV